MDQYAKSFTKPSIRIGTITVLLAMLGSFFPNIYLYLAHGVWQIGRASCRERV